MRGDTTKREEHTLDLWPTEYTCKPVLKEYIPYYSLIIKIKLGVGHCRRSISESVDFKVVQLAILKLKKTVENDREHKKYLHPLVQGEGRCVRFLARKNTESMLSIDIDTIANN